MTTVDLETLRAKSCRELMSIALDVKLRHRGSQFSLCSIINAKSGQCSENCRFCAQSAHFKTEAPVYPLLDKKTILKAARQAKEDKAQHFSIVTSGRGLNSADVKKVAEIISAIRSDVGIAVCSSLGILKKEDFLILKEAGMTRYHHNLETSKEFFPQIVTTHSFDERVDTIVAAQEVGIEVCSGGIFGLGETEVDRISMALTLRELHVDSVPINILIPLPGTPLAGQQPLKSEEILRSIALYRIILQDIPVRLAAGRESALQDFLSSAFMAGADGMMIGGYLTERGRPTAKDLEFVQQMQRLWEC
nr:biotin synthase BioB [Desulfobulbaceae bacterium]